MKIYQFFLIFFLLGCLIYNAEAQVDSVSLVKRSPYALISSYYSMDFTPFKKRNVYIGLAFSVQDERLVNTTHLLQNIIEGNSLDYDLLLKGGYYVNDYVMYGINASYYQSKFEGTVLRNSDTVNSNTIRRGCEITPNMRSSIPLTSNERLSFFTEIGISFGVAKSLTRTNKDIDDFGKTYVTEYNFGVGISPGITFFAIENFAFEVQLNVLGYELIVKDKTIDDEEKSHEVRQNVDFNINLLSLELGLAYYFGADKNK